MKIIYDRQFAIFDLQLGSTDCHNAFH